jgi:hypothetical protein
MSSFINDHSIRTASIRNRDLKYLLCSFDNADPEFRNTTFVVKDENEWCGGGAEWTAISCCIITNPKEQCVSLGDDGHINVIGSGEELDEQIAEPSDRHGDLREVRAIDGLPYVVGMDRQCFRRPKPGVWERFDQGLAIGGPDLPGLESIHGFSAGEIYAVGWNGEIWERSARTKKLWKLIGQPTNLAFLRVLCAGDGVAYAAGQGGILYAGRGKTWKPINHEATTDDIQDLEWFGGKLWISTMTRVYTLDDGQFTLIDFDGDPPDGCHHLSAADGILWTIGAKDVRQYDGTEWTTIL